MMAGKGSEIHFFFFGYKTGYGRANKIWIIISISRRLCYCRYLFRKIRLFPALLIFNNKK